MMVLTRRLSAIVQDARIGNTQRRDGFLDERRFLASCLQQRELHFGHDNGERDSGKSSTRTNINHSLCFGTRKERHQGQAVLNVSHPHGFRLNDGGHIEARVGIAERFQVRAQPLGITRLKFNAHGGECFSDRCWNVRNRRQRRKR